LLYLLLVFTCYIYYRTYHLFIYYCTYHLFINYCIYICQIKLNKFIDLWIYLIIN
jgi:hypothetical protein